MYIWTMILNWKILRILKKGLGTFLSDYPFYLFYSLNEFLYPKKTTELTSDYQKGEHRISNLLQNCNGKFRLAYLDNIYTFVSSVMIIGFVGSERL